MIIIVTHVETVMIIISLIIVVCIHLLDRIVTCGSPTIRSSGDTAPSVPRKPSHFTKFNHCHHLYWHRCHLLYRQTCLDDALCLPTTCEVFPILGKTMILDGIETPKIHDDNRRNDHNSDHDQ